MAFDDSARHPIAVATDILAASAIFGSIVSWLPPIAAFLSIVWFMIQIWESNTTQKSLIGWRTRRQQHKLARLHAKAKITAARIAAIEVQHKALDDTN